MHISVVSGAVASDSERPGNHNKPSGVNGAMCYMQAWEKLAGVYTRQALLSFVLQDLWCIHMVLE